MTNWSAGITAAGTVVSAGGIGFVAVQVSEARRARGMSEVAAYNDARARMDAAAPRVEVHVSSPAWPPLGDSSTGGVPQPYPGGTEWHFPGRQDHRLLLQTELVVINRSERTVRATFEGDLWEIDAPDGRPRQMVREMLLSPAKPTAHAYLRGGVSLKEWAEIDARVRDGESVEPVVRARIIVHDDADEGVIDVWEPWLTGTPIAEDPNRGSVWRLTPPPFNGGEHGDWCLQYDIQPVRRRSYWSSREDQVLLLPPAPAAQQQTRRRGLGRS